MRWCIEDLRGRAGFEDLPASMKTTVSATSRAKPISWVTMTSVVPERASSLMTSSTSPTSSGSSAEVGSSKSSTFGFKRQRAGDGDALLLAAGKLARIGIGLVRQADAGEQLARQRSRRPVPGRAPASAPR